MKIDLKIILFIGLGMIGGSIAFGFFKGKEGFALLTPAYWITITIIGIFIGAFAVKLSVGVITSRGC